MPTSGREHDQLSPRLRDRMWAALLRNSRGPRIVWLRKIAAAVLFLLAGALALLPRGAAAGLGPPVLVAAHDLAPGQVITRTDLESKQLPSQLIPSGALRDRAAAEGRVLSGAARGGEPLTDVRLTGDALTRLAAGEQHAAVAIRLADPGVADLLHPGRRVDVVTTSLHSGARPENTVTLAERVPVLAIRPAEGRREQGRLIVVGIPERNASQVAAASLTDSVTVTLR